MSGITPLIDTLLHQVLGKRVDVPVPRELNAPVQPTSPNEAVQALRSDSRLDPRTAQAPLIGRAGTAPEPTSATPAPGQAPASTQTHFSPSAQTIATLLERFPAPPSTLRIQGPLMPSASASGAGDAAQLASRLQQSIDTSGLFYESHLTKWYRGELPRHQLMREPQMQRATAQRPFQQLTPVTTPANAMASPLSSLAPSPASGGLQAVTTGSVPWEASRAAGHGALAPQGAIANGAAPSAPGAGAATLREGAAPSISPGLSGERSELSSPAGAERSSQASTNAGGLDEAQQAVVRHQLELLATPSPVLRWEGDVWSGVFMALVVQMPRGQGEGDEAAADADDDQAFAFQTQMSLKVAGLGELDVALRLAARRLEVTLSAEHQDVLAHLAGGEPSLRSRLEACGFESVTLHITQQTPSHPEGGAS